MYTIQKENANIMHFFQYFTVHKLFSKWKHCQARYELNRRFSSHFTREITGRSEYQETHFLKAKNYLSSFSKLKPLHYYMYRFIRSK